MIDYDYPDLFLGDAVYKNFIITDGEVEVINDNSWAITAEATVAITNENLESESFELHQSLNSEMQLRFGSCESAYISFTCHDAWLGDIANLKGKVLNVYIIPNNHATKIIQIGVFKVQENKLTNDRKARKITAYDAMYDIINSDVANWYNNVAFMPIPIAPEPSVAMSSFRNFFLAYFGLEAEETTLVNDSIVLHKTINPDTLSGADVIKAICEINGVFGMITNEGKFRFVELASNIREDSEDVTDIEVSQYIDVEYEDYDSLAITGVKVITNKETKFFASAETPENIYTINGNFLISDYQGTDLFMVARKLATKLYNHYYQPLTVNALGNPVHEVGDAIKVILKDGTELPTYILERTLRGIQALRDTYTARGEEEASESLNSISSRYTQLENNAIQAATEAATVASTTDFVEIIRNIGFRLLDEPSDVTVEYDDTNNEVSLNWTDPDDISSNEPSPATWVGTVVVRKENSAPKHRWDGTLIEDSTTRDEYSETPLVDNTIEEGKAYYYGIFPYDTKGDYRFTKVVSINTSVSAIAITMSSLIVDRDNITANYSIPSGYTWDYILLVYKKGSEPADKTDGTAVSLSDSSTYTTLTGLDQGATYYLKIFAEEESATVSGSSNSLHAKTQHTVTESLYDLQVNKVIGANVTYSTPHGVIPSAPAAEGQDISVDERSNEYSMPVYTSGEYAYAFRSYSYTGIRQYLFAITSKKIRSVSCQMYLSPDRTGYQDIIYFYSSFFYNGTFTTTGIGSRAEVGTNEQYTDTTPKIPANTWSDVSFDADDSSLSNYILFGAWSGVNKIRNVVITYWED